MARLATGLIVLVLSLGNAACTLPLVGPTTPSGYFFTLRVSDSAIWMPPTNFMSPTPYPIAAVLMVRVQNAQGVPLDGIPVAFQVEPTWEQDVSLTPRWTITQNGTAKAVLRAYMVGIVRVQARVEGLTQEVRIAVHPTPSWRNRDGD